MNLRLLTLPALLLFFVPLADAAPGSQRLGFPSGLSYTLALDDQKPARFSAWIRISPLVKENELGAVKVRILDVDGPLGKPVGLIEGFKVEPQFKTMSEGVGAGLKVSVTAEQRLPGNYTVLIEVSGPPGPLSEKEVLPPAGAEPQLVTLILKREAPVIAPPPSVIVTQEYPLLGSATSTPGLLILRETGQKSPLVKYHVVDQPDATVSGENSGNLLARGNSPCLPTVEVDNAVSLQVTPLANYPLGKHTGKLLVLSREMTSILTVPYEIHVRRHQGWIFVAAFLGLLFGWLTRVRLQGIREKAVAESTASEALQTLKTTFDSARDLEFKSAISAAIKTLEEETRGAKAPAILAAASKAGLALATAEQKLVERSKPVAEKIEGNEQELRRNWVLPNGVQSALTALHNELKTLRLLFQNHDVGSAEKRLEEEWSAAMLHTVRTADGWRKTTAAYLAELVNNPPALRDEGVTHLQQATTTWKIAYEETTLMSKATIKDVVAALDKVFNAYDNVQAITGAVKEEGGKLAEILRQMEGLDGQKGPFAELLESQATPIKEDLQTAAPKKDRPAILFRERVQSWETALGSIGGFSSAATAAILADVRAGAWIAAFQAMTAPRDQPLSPPRALRTILVVPADPIRLGRVQETHPFLLEAAPSLQMPALEGTPAERARFARAERFAVVGQTWVAGLIFMILAYKIFSPDWVGNFSDLFNIFGWGFFVDLTADNVLSQYRHALPTKAQPANS